MRNKVKKGMHYFWSNNSNIWKRETICMRGGRCRWAERQGGLSITITASSIWKFKPLHEKSSNKKDGYNFAM